MFKIYSKKTRTKQIADTLFFNHKYLTSPVVTTVDRIVSVAKQLTAAAAGISKGELKDMKNLREFTKLFHQIAAQNKEK